MRAWKKWKRHKNQLLFGEATIKEIKDLRQEYKSSKKWLSASRLPLWDGRKMRFKAKRKTYELCFVRNGVWLR